MGGYGHTYESYSTSNPLRSKTDQEPLRPAIRKPFVPFVPNPNRNPQEYVTRSKTLVPVATGRSYGDEYSKRVSPTTTRDDDDDEYWRRQTSPSVQNEASRPPRSTPALTTDGRASPRSSVGYADNGNRQDHWTVGTPLPNDNYGNYNHTERHKPIGISSIGDRNDSYDYDRPNRMYGNGWSRPNATSTWSSFYDNGYGPKNSSAWTAPPRNGTQLSKPTNDIGKASGLLKETARVNGYDDSGNKGRPKDEGYNYNFQRKNDEVDRPNPSIWAEPPGKEPSKTDGTTPRKDDYYYTDTTNDATRRYGIFNFKSRLRTRQF